MSSASSGSQMLDVTRDAHPEPESKTSRSHGCGNGDSCPSLTRLLLSQEPCKHLPRFPSCIIAEQGWWEPPHEETLPSDQEISPPPLRFICNSMTLGLIEEAGTSHHLWAVQLVFPSAESWKQPVLHCFEWKWNESKCNVAYSANHNQLLLGLYPGKHHSSSYFCPSTQGNAILTFKPHSLWTSPHFHASTSISLCDLKENLSL